VGDELNFDVLIGAIGLLCTIGAFLIGYFAFRREKDNDIRKNAAESAVIKTKLDAISTGIQNIQVDIRTSDRRLGEAEKDIIRVEEIAKSAHKRIDHLENKGEISQ
jgi:septal ring factor EnvC (AmiA/AmiB activator)